MTIWNILEFIFGNKLGLFIPLSISIFDKCYWGFLRLRILRKILLFNKVRPIENTDMQLCISVFIIFIVIKSNI